MPIDFDALDLGLDLDLELDLELDFDFFVAGAREASLTLSVFFNLSDVTHKFYLA